MTILLISISILLLAAVAIMAVKYNALYGKCTALEKENSMLDARCTSLHDDVKRANESVNAQQALREEQFARTAALESENKMLTARIDEQKEQSKATLEQFRV